MADQLYFYSKSKDVAPGKGVREKVANANDYEALSRIKNWRQILSNFHVFPFRYGNYTWNTIEHAFQATKLALDDPDIQYQFALESESKLSQGDGLAARKMRKLILLDQGQLERWNQMRTDIMRDIAMEKLNACPELREVILATRNAELWHLIPRSNTPVRFKHLEEWRDRE
jgi:predicted NAD-dependent protein-ADP-ribosyltransferase YbiA (DUF1768 family)